MPRFILIDPWLDGVGGHNYQYAVDVLQAAREMGYGCVLVTNDRFTDPGFEPAWRLVPAFRYRSSSRYWLGPDGKGILPVGIDGRPLPGDPHASAAGWSRAASRLRRCCDWQGPDRRRRIERYARDCRAVFTLLGWRATDLVFLPSLSEFDFLGVARFLHDTPESRGADWHLQFHFDIFSGREDEYDSQQHRLLRFRRQFAAAIARVPNHRLHFYATTDQIAEQYDRMRVACFQGLPYPVSRALAPPGRRTHEGPLRVTCPGIVRREKGRVGLARLVREFTDGSLADGRMQLVLQVDRNALGRVLPRRLARSIEILPGPDPTCDRPIVPVAYPLAAAAYAELIRQADIGLLPYDARRYYARCSGVLVEMLAAGVPVIVPAGCWLGDQIGTPAATYLDRLTRGAPAQPVRRADDAIPVPEDAGSVVVRLRIDRSTMRTPYVEVWTRQLDNRHAPVRSPPGVIMRLAPGGGPVSCLVDLHRDARFVGLGTRSAYASDPVKVTGAEVVFLHARSIARAGEDRHPRSSVGLTAATPDEIPALLLEIATHYGHYRRSATEFAASWRDAHAAARTVEALADNGGGRAGEAGGRFGPG